MKKGDNESEVKTHINALTFIFIIIIIVIITYLLLSV